MLEDRIIELTTAVKDLTAAMAGKVAPTVPGKSGKTSTTPPAATAPKLTFEQVKAAVVTVKDQLGKPAAQAIIKGQGKASELASIKPAQYAAVMAACEAAIAEEPDAGEEEAAEEDGL